ncbi:protein XRI1 isoform X3 [Humulus lupulus]|uniref:protein XRI1 isoform X3 n=1 Tax=Humulus lupulus TaxID=3486 RepID=UPI002B404EEA|nr:protein XRI1 isoform X3 [Humulus lupulus]
MDCDNDNAQWGWQKDSYFQKDPNYVMSEGLWNGVAQNEEDISYMFDEETTPVKACMDLEYHVDHKDTMNKEVEECRESFSQMKRRRMLQFTNDDFDNSLLCDEISSVFLKSNEVDSLEEALPSASDWISGFTEDTSASASGYETLDHSDEWITDCLNDNEMHFSSDTMNTSGTSDFQIDIAEFCEIAPEHENNLPQQRVSTPQKIVFKGRKSFIRTPTKLATSVAYPFAFIKPSGAHGDVTLKDINQRIRTPPPLKSKKATEDPSIPYPTSAFSGKPVVGKTKIRTEGGRGSITIMRTKG